MHESVSELRHYLRERVWNNAELNDRERTLATYLLLGEQTTDAGIFCLSVPRAGQRIGCGPAETEAHFARTIEVQGWKWDAEARVLWITDWFRAFPLQERAELSKVLELVRQLPPTPLVAEWCRRTGDLPDWMQEPFAFAVSAVLAPEVIVAGDLVKAKPPVVLTDWVFQIKANATWTLEEWRYKEYQKLYGATVNVDRELEEAKIWCRDHKAERKTANGMPSFLTKWLKKSQSRQGGRAISEQIERRRADPRGNAAALERFMERIGG